MEASPGVEDVFGDDLLPAVLVVPGRWWALMDGQRHRAAREGACLVPFGSMPHCPAATRLCRCVGSHPRDTRSVLPSITTLQNGRDSSIY